MMAFDDLRTALLRILEIDEKIRDIEHGQEYLLLRRNLKVLEHPTKGYITVNALDDPSKVIKRRRNSADLQVLIIKYREKMRYDVENIRNLKMEKLRLRSKIHKAPNCVREPG